MDLSRCSKSKFVLPTGLPSSAKGLNGPTQTRAVFSGKSFLAWTSNIPKVTKLFHQILISADVQTFHAVTASVNTFTKISTETF